jgi:hypothetical protein
MLKVVKDKKGSPMATTQDTNVKIQSHLFGYEYLKASDINSSSRLSKQLHQVF